MHLAIVVCSRDRPEQLRSSLAALVGFGVETLVVDSASRATSTAEVAAGARIRCLRVDQPGLARARNAAFRHTDADLVCFTDDDCIAAPGWLDALKAAAAGPRVGVVLGRVESAGVGIALSVHSDDTPRNFARGDDLSRAGHGANLAVRRDCWADLGGFDELLGVGALLRAGEDSDLLWRATSTGWLARYEPRAVVRHEQWRGRATALRTSYGYGVGAGAVGVKVRRLGGRVASRAWSDGSVTLTARQAGVDLAHRYPFGAAIGVARLVGLLTGRARARRLGLVDGHFR